MSVRSEQENSSRVEGRNPVLEAFRAGKTVDKLYVQDGCRDGVVLTILREAKKQNTMISFMPKNRLDAMSETKAHQGVIAQVAAASYADLEDLLAAAEAGNEPPFLILLDGIEDPHNLGSIIRSADLCGAHGIIIPKHRSAGLTAVAAKASAGAVHYVPVARVANMAQTIDELKEKGFWFYCADASGSSMYETDFSGPVGLVIGNEGSGVSRLVKEKCDVCVSIPMKGHIDSLNAAVAGAVLMFEIAHRRDGRQK